MQQRRNTILTPMGILLPPNGNGNERRDADFWPSFTHIYMYTNVRM